MNKVVLIGRLARDVELKAVNGTSSVATFTLAVSRPKTSDGESSADFIPCQCWNKLAENVNRFCSKGSQVAVEGSIRTRSYENKEGNKVNVTEIICSSVEFLGSKQDAQPKAKKEVDPFANFDSFDVIEDGDIQF